MLLVDVVPDDTLSVPGYERHTFRCPQCGDKERRLVFAREGKSRVAEAETSASKPPARQTDEPASSAAAPAEPAPQLAGPVFAAAPAQRRPARPMTSFALPSALTQRVSKLVTAVRSLLASASRLGKPSIRKAPPASAPMLDRPLPSPVAPPALQPPPFDPIASVTQSPVTNEPGSARRPPDPTAVLTALATIAALPRKPAELAPTASASHPDEAQASSIAPLAATSEPRALIVSAALAPVSMSYRGEAKSISVAPDAPKSETAEASAPARAPAPPLSVASEAEAGIDEEEDLLRRAIEILHGPAPASQPASAVPLKPAAAKPTAPVKRADLTKANHASQAEKSLARRAVRIERAPDDAAKYLAKDITSGLTVMRHRDTAHLRAMCDWIGWQVVDE